MFSKVALILMSWIFPQPDKEYTNQAKVCFQLFSCCSHRKTLNLFGKVRRPKPNDDLIRWPAVADDSSRPLTEPAGLQRQCAPRHLRPAGKTRTPSQFASRPFKTYCTTNISLAPCKHGGWESSIKASKISPTTATATAANCEWGCSPRPCQVFTDKGEDFHHVSKGFLQVLWIYWRSSPVNLHLSIHSDFFFDGFVNKKEKQKKRVV